GYKSEVKGYDITNTKIKESTGTSTNTGTSTSTNTDTGTKTSVENPKAPSTNGDNKTTVALPKTGGTPAEMISMVGGMVLFVLGGMLFRRQRAK
ncbi:LPXTG cell wall anchor domain-containing protein, partial [Bacillus sp. JJ864]|uniref:LPXTG cell wall anchor domain-containing protein n=1 Tax=Bacillus sp. JJ864 TaxID=3122975 RepID=UPI0030004E30